MSVDLPLLSIVVWLPIVGGLLLLVLGDRQSALLRWSALVLAVATFVFSIPLFTAFDRTTAAMQFVERVPWIAQYNVYYHLGVDGISMPLILLTTFVTVLVVIAGWDSITKRPAQYFANA